MNDAAQFQPANRNEWRQWLAENYGNKTGVWLVWFKKHTGISTITYDEAVEEALCFGWIDSVPRKVDNDRTSLYFSPRKPKSEWSKLNKERIAKLEQLGLIMPSGQAKIDQAKNDGSWDTLNDSDNLIIPNDLMQALVKYKEAERNFNNFPPGVRKNILAWINSAKTQETRNKRISLTAELAEQNIRVNQWRPSA